MPWTKTLPDREGWWGNKTWAMKIGSLRHIIKKSDGRLYVDWQDGEIWPVKQCTGEWWHEPLQLPWEQQERMQYDH
jgi:hypothetical protein